MVHTMGCFCVIFKNCPKVIFKTSKLLKLPHKFTNEITVRKEY
ncbi:hypothetical protein SaSA73_0305 [Streptococcus agalactiae]|nr:hypothetical protein SaSA53_0304 [Streptococcus agalactiae]AUO84808.1 hypothetical protein SaSA73_0305 [Streptococcus agalactiae]AUO93041.1 hypothetical protein SaSA75_0304 [Streptococcus agalactiae]AUO98038.1 hypothetical protein SaSA85_0304 [Streptococcus agalactiae]AUO99645.1 hypothetical protein SaSA95_0304 [Streptococcus agalactiae]